MHWTVWNRLSLSYFLPEAWLIILAMLLLLVEAFSPRGRRLALSIGLMGLLGHFLLTARLLSTPVTFHGGSLFSGMIAADRFAIFFKLFFGLVALVTIAFVARAKELKGYGMAEMIAFLFAITVGMSMMAASTDILMMYLTLEMVSLLSFVMVGYKRRSRTSSEAGLKYILYGAVSSGVMLFGLSYLFGLTGSTNLGEIAVYFGNLEGIRQAPIVLFALICTMIGFGYKTATFPSQMWCPDVYEGAPLPITALLSVGPKAAGFAMTIRFFFSAFGGPNGWVEIFEIINWDLFLAVIAAITMTIGNLAALPQRNLKRLMAYSSIAHAGYLLMGLAALSAAGLQAILFYLVTYLLMNFGAFWIILVVGNRLGTEEIDGFRGLGWRSPLLGSTLAIFLFSLTGLPPLAGFMGKLLIFSAVIQEGLYWLAVVAAINTVVSFFYYARVIRTMFLESPVNPSHLSVTGLSRLMPVFFAIPTLVLGVYWEPLWILTIESVSSFF